MDISDLFLVGVYIVLTVINLIAVYLYHKAYVQMKRTPIIRSVLVLLLALLIENLYFLAVAITVAYNGHGTFLENPILWSVPKLLLMFALALFILCSTTSDPTKNCGLNGIKEGDNDKTDTRRLNERAKPNRRRTKNCP